MVFGYIYIICSVTRINEINVAAVGLGRAKFHFKHLLIIQIIITIMFQSIDFFSFCATNAVWRTSSLLRIDARYVILFIFDPFIYWNAVTGVNRKYSPSDTSIRAKNIMFSHVRNLYRMQVERPNCRPVDRVIARAVRVRARGAAAAAYMHYGEKVRVRPPPPAPPLVAAPSRRALASIVLMHRGACGNALDAAGAAFRRARRGSHGRWPARRSVRGNGRARAYDAPGTARRRRDDNRGRASTGKYRAIAPRRQWWGSGAHPRRTSREFGAHRPMCCLRSVQRLLIAWNAYFVFVVIFAPVKIHTFRVLGFWRPRNGYDYIIIIV